MKPEITQNGVEVQEFQEVFNELVSGYKKIYGQDINLDQDSPDGQRIGITAKMAYDLQTFGQYIYSNLDPDFSSGQFQNVIIKFNGISRRPATRSQKDITITTSKAITLPVDFEVKDNLDQIWTIDGSENLAAGDNVITFYAKKFGSIESQANATFRQQLIIEGITSISSTETAIVGQNEESDEDLRIRRNKTFENAAYSTVGGLLSKLVQLTNVTDAIVYENDQETADSDKNMPPHSIWCIVQGGSISDIIECIVKNKTAGTYTKGSVSGEYIENITRQNGSIFSIVHNMRFDRPKAVNLHVKLTVKRKIQNYAIDVNQIKKSLTNKQFYINDVVDASSLYCDVYSVNGQFTAYELMISNDGVNYTSESLTALYDEYFVINADNVEVKEII